MHFYIYIFFNIEMFSLDSAGFPYVRIVFITFHIQKITFQKYTKDNFLQRGIFLLLSILLVKLTCMWMGGNYEKSLKTYL